MLAATSETLSGQVPAKEDNYEISRSLPAALVHAVAAEGEGNQLHKAAEEDKAKENAHGRKVA